MTLSTVNPDSIDYTFNRGKSGVKQKFLGSCTAESSCLSQNPTSCMNPAVVIQ